jgi:hypothetical protein
LVFNATFSNISAISWRPVLVVEEGLKFIIQYFIWQKKIDQNFFHPILFYFFAYLLYFYTTFFNILYSAVHFDLNSNFLTINSWDNLTFWSIMSIISDLIQHRNTFMW